MILSAYFGGVFGVAAGFVFVVMVDGTVWLIAKALIKRRERK